jgi:hypothetical protein
MASSSLIKTVLHRALAEGVYRDVVTRSSSYYYFLGQTISWDDDYNPPYPTDSLAYEHETRNQIITFKEIRPSDVAFVVPKHTWTSGIIYDMYDDQYSDEVIGINIVSGGANYFSLEDAVIEITGGGGTGAAATPVLLNGSIVGVDMVSKGSGYTSTPTVRVLTTSGDGTADLKAVVNIAPSGAQKIEDARFYVVTEDYNVYKCLDNNGGVISTSKPSSTALQPMRLADGYVWKYMYSIPINLRNKFLTETHMPVVSALTNQFYSRGSLDNIFIANKGAGYTTASIQVTGDGYRSGDPIFLESVSVSTGGSGYSAETTITVQDPVQNASVWISEGAINIAQIIYNSNYDFYQAENSGTFADYEPTHEEGISLNGSVALKYLGTRAKGYPVIEDNVEVAPGIFEDGVITAINLYGSVREIRIINPGSGYIEPPAIYLTSNTGLYAQATAKMYADKVISAKVVNQGSGYEEEPTVVIGEAYTSYDQVYIGQQFFSGAYLYTVEQDGINGTQPPDLTTSGSIVVSSAQWLAGAIATLDETVYVGNRLYRITTEGTFGQSAPSHTSGVATNGTAELTYLGIPSRYSYAGQRATGVSVLRHGTGYSFTPEIYITDPADTNPGAGATCSFLTSKSEAKLIPIIEFGQVQTVIIEDGGIGYTKAEIEVVDTGINGRGARLVADLSIGAIGSQQANNEILTPSGTIDAIAVVSGGYGYSVANVTITGDGSGATAEAVIDTTKTSSISHIKITNRGSGYTYAEVNITGQGYGATARPIISPYGGHGKNSPEELYARTLMFYSNISTDLNQGMSVKNDYRQVGIVKNPRVFEGVEYYQNALGSACYVVQTTLDDNALAEFTRDTDVYIERDVPPDTEWTALTNYPIGTYLYSGDKIYLVITAGTSSRNAPTETVGVIENGTMALNYIGSTRVKKRYRIVSATSNSVLLQSLDQDEPATSDIVYKNAAHSFAVATVGKPTVDKYSGQMMFIDNKQGFTPSADETITLRTIIQF